MAGSSGQPTMGAFPWAATKSNTLWATRTTATDQLGMGRLITDTTAQNNLFTVDLYFDSVTWKLALIFGKDTDQGIYNVTGVSGTQTFDAYAAASSNNYSEATSIAVSAPGVKTVQFSMATKNASSSAYGAKLNSWCWIETSGTFSTPAGTDTPGYTNEWFLWMGSKANTNWTTRSQSSGFFGGGTHNSGGSQNDAISTDFWQDTGTHKVALMYYAAVNQGIATIQRNGVTWTTIDNYANPGGANTHSEVTGLTNATAEVKTFQLIMASKNASSGGYGANVNSFKVIRTGA